MMRREKQDPKQPSLLRRAARYIHAWVPGLLPLCVLSAFLRAFPPLATVFFSARILGELLGARDPRQLLISTLLLLGIRLVSDALLSAVNIWKNAGQTKLLYAEWEAVSAVHLSTDFEHLEDPAYQRAHRTYNDLRNMNGHFLYGLAWSLEEALSALFSMLLSAGMTWGLFFAPGADRGLLINAPWVSVALTVLILVGALCSAALRAKGQNHFAAGLENSATFNRLFFFFFGRIGDYRYGKEIRLFQEQPMITGLAQEGMWEEGGRTISAMSALLSRFQGGSAAISYALTGLAYFFVAMKAFYGMIPIAGLVQYVGAMTRFSTGCVALAEALAQAGVYRSRLPRLLDILDVKPVKYQGTLPVEKRRDFAYELEFHDVSFRYPGAEAYALRHLNLKLRLGERLAVVGMNGSGKTTMIKLLCRLYDPTEGYISLNGIDIRKYNEEEYARLFSVVFQDFHLFSFSLGQNVAAAVDYDPERAAEALGQAGMGDRLTSLDRGLETPLYRDFEPDGVEVSGGEAQKIALARALYKDAPFIILDEPTAALDPVAEYEIYTRFNQWVGGRTAVYISHRLSSCRFCDNIAVFHEGRLIQRGSHEALLADRQGKYAELWDAQARYYAENTGESRAEDAPAPIGG